MVPGCEGEFVYPRPCLGNPGLFSLFYKEGESTGSLWHNISGHLALLYFVNNFY